MSILSFDMNISEQKPETILNKKALCPFCDRKNLTDIICTEGEMILLKNKYNVLTTGDQFVFIESYDCKGDIPDYEPSVMVNILRFGIKHWYILLKKPAYKSVIFFKNYGFLAGGTIRHPHMQLIGLKEVAEDTLLSTISFKGLPVAKKNDIHLTFSLEPRIGFGEFCISLPEVPSTADEWITVSQYLQKTVHYLKYHFTNENSSYNLFFYRKKGNIFIKILPRFPSSPLFIGYDIRLLPTNYTEVVKEFQKLYF